MSKRNMYEQPSLPEGYFFRVSASTRWEGWCNVAIMRKRWMGYKVVVKTDCMATKANIGHAMNTIKNIWEERKRADSLLGDYPPKKLGDM